MIALGAALIAQYHWILYVFGAFLIVTGIKMLALKTDHTDPNQNIVVRLTRRIFPITARFHGQHFVVKAGVPASYESEFPGTAALPSLPYFGQPVPGLTPELFAPGIVNTDAIEFNGVFSPDGREFFFGRHVAGVDTMFHSVYADGRWSDPVRLPAFPGDVSGDMAVSPDGRELYFLGQHPNEYAPENPTWDTWVSHRVGGEWTLARVVPPPVSTEAMEVYPVVVGDGYEQVVREPTQCAQSVRCLGKPDRFSQEP